MSYCGNNSKKFKGLQQLIISKSHYVLVAVSQLWWLLSTSLPFCRSSPIWGMLVLRQRREDERAGETWTSSHSVCSHSLCVTFAYAPFGHSKSRSHAGCQQGGDVSSRGQLLVNGKNI